MILNISPSSLICIIWSKKSCWFSVCWGFFLVGRWDDYFRTLYIHKMEVPLWLTLFPSTHFLLLENSKPHIIVLVFSKVNLYLIPWYWFLFLLALLILSLYLHLMDISSNIFEISQNQSQKRHATGDCWLC